MNNNHGIPDHLFTVQNSDNTYSWTLGTRMGQFLSEIETLYGALDTTLTLLGFEFNEGRPNIRFSGYPARRQIIIRLGEKAFKSAPQAIYQLAHECIHLLAPVVGGDAPVLEEGLATMYSEDKVKALYPYPRMRSVPVRKTILMPQPGSGSYFSLSRTPSASFVLWSRTFTE